jgi:acyl-CoA reductase-like NAD-dependent aldehyde dehydrogenase
MDLTPMLIDGNEVGAHERTEVRSPFDGRLVGVVPTGTTGHLDDAVAVAARRHQQGAPPLHERCRILERAADLIAADSEGFARQISDESAKPITTARTEAARAVDTFRFAAATARTLAGDVVPLAASTAGDGFLGFTLRVPVGVVAGITPFNFPLNLVAHKVAPAIAAGCPVVLKPASATPLSALRLARVLAEAGLPAGWLNVVTASGRVANHLVTHDDVAMITFTGSAPVGWAIRAGAPRKRVGLELGNNAPVIVDATVPDLADVARRVAAAGYGFAGQSCISVQRVYVTHPVAEAFTDALAEAADALNVGDPADDRTQVSALITPDDTGRVRALIDDAVGAGARVVSGGVVRDLGAHGVLVPTVLDRVDPAMAISRTEVFGPVVGVRAVADLDEAIRLANDTAFGLQAGIFTADIDAALGAAHRLNFGGVTVNEVPTWRADQMPYGGVGDSGNTKEGPAWAIREMTDERLVAIRYS